MNYLILDYETRSEANLKEVGGFEYATHPSTQIMCAGWKVLTGGKAGKTKTWSPFLSGDPTELLYYICDTNTKIVAHNAFFEQVITRYVLAREFPHPELRQLPHDKWICTASLAAALALPRKLEGACSALALPVQKDMEGHRLMLKYSKPRKATKNNKAKWHNRLADLKRLIAYCATDVEAETLLFQTLPALTEKERHVWLLDQQINFRGFNTDKELVGAALTLIGEETQNLNRETEELTLGIVSTVAQRDEVLDYLKLEGLALPDLTANTVKDALAGRISSPIAKRLLELRQAASKTSTAKYAAFHARSKYDGRVRDILMYHGASTGRWTGIGVQPQNFPRGTIKNTEQLTEIIKQKDLELLRLIYGNPLDALSSALRGVIVPHKGFEFFSGDYSAIEARTLLWVANDEPGLEIFHSGQDPYKHMAARIYDKVLANVTKPERELGKRAELGCGFGMGAPKFKDTCKDFGGMVVDEALAKKAVSIYRQVHQPVVKLWGNLERAAIYAVREKKKIMINRTAWFVEDKILYCELPSGRRLAYYGPEIRMKNTPWGEPRPTLYHWGVHPITRKWVCDGTYGGRLTENVVQAIARDIMAEASIRIEDKGYHMVLTVHDELLAECKIGLGNLDEFVKIMASPPIWADGCPIKVEGWQSMRYRK